jgi:hypothetical protein
MLRKCSDGATTADGTLALYDRQAVQPYRFLVASRPSGDLLLCAKHLFVEAMAQAARSRARRRCIMRAADVVADEFLPRL